MRDPVCYLLTATGDITQLMINARAALEAANAAGMPYIQAMSRVFLCMALAESHRHEELLSVSAEARHIVGGTCHAHYEAELDLIEAYSCFIRADHATGLECLRRGLASASRKKDLLHLVRHDHRILQLLGTEAIQEGIETTYVGQLLSRLKVNPSDPALESWPWPVKIYSLGAFNVYLCDKRVEFSRKAPKKPLSLLKALIAYGGRNVPEERLMDALWPDEEADAARKSLDITVLRLRKLLGGNDTIIVSEETVGFNPQMCWIDAWAFEMRAGEAQTGPDSAPAAEALALYRGNLLPADVERPWTVKMRERLRAKFVRLIETVANEEENAGHRDNAIGHYLKGLEADDLVEAFHLGLMRCYQALGGPAEAISAYRRLRHTLSVVLGIAPSAVAEKLARDLQEGSAARPA